MKELDEAISKLDEILEDLPQTGESPFYKPGFMTKQEKREAGGKEGISANRKSVELLANKTNVKYDDFTSTMGKAIRAQTLDNKDRQIVARTLKLILSQNPNVLAGLK